MTRTAINNKLVMQEDVSEWELIWVDVDSIDDYSAQPEHRADFSKISTLLESMSESGLIVPPLLVPSLTPKRFVRIDGHRRGRAAELLGIKRMQCLVLKNCTPKKRYTLFQRANCHTRQVDGNERVRAWALTPVSWRNGALDAMKPSQKKQIEDLREIFTDQELTRLSGAGKSLASIGKLVRAVTKWCDGRGLEAPDNETIARWIIKYKKSRLIDSIARNVTWKAASAVVSAINEDRDYKGPNR